MKKRAHQRRIFRSAAIVLTAVLVIAGAYVLTGAGALAPDVAPAGTYTDLSSVYDAIASSGYDSSSITADSNGSAFQVTKCLIERITGGSCP